MGHAVGWGGGSRSPDSRPPSGAGGHGALASPRVIGTSTHLPQILCIHLKRFRHEVMYSFKISSHVSFPLEGLDLRPFLAKECTSQITTYDLLSVICHRGTAGSESMPAPAPPPPSPPGAPSPPVSPTAGGHYIGFQLFLTLCNPMDCNPPGSFVHRILQARILEWVSIPFSR